MHQIALFIKNKLKHYGRRDFFFNFAPLRNIRVEIHRVVSTPFLFVRVTRKVIDKISESLIIEKWIPIEEYKFYFEQKGNIRKGTIFLAKEGREWRRYSPSRIISDKKLEQKLKDLRKLIAKANRLSSYS